VHSAEAAKSTRPGHTELCCSAATTPCRPALEPDLTPCSEQLRRLLDTSTIERARHEKMILGCYVLAADMEETWRLWTTMEVWWPAVEVLIASRVTNARTEAANTTIKHIKRTGRGYRNPAHYQARILLTSAARRAA
jgi:transposase